MDKTDAGQRWLTAAALTLLLSSCASLSGEQAPAPAGQPAAVPPSTTTTTIAELPDDGIDNSALLDEINREGRVIQLGRFTEPQPPVAPPDNNVVELNYEQEDLRLVLEQIGDALNLNMVIDPTIDNRVSVRTSPNNPLGYEDLWALMRLLARNAGVTIEQVGNVYEFTRNASAVPTEILLPGDLDQAGAADVLQVTPLTYISVEAAETILNPLLQPEGSIIRLGPANLLGINGTPEQLSRVNALLAVIDDDPFLNQGIQLFELQNAAALEVAEELTSVLQLVEGDLTSYQVLGLERINAVLVIAPAGRGFEEVARWVRILDSGSQQQGDQLFVYRVKSLSAVSLANTLTNVFGDGEGTVQPRVERDEPPGNQPRPAVPDDQQPLLPPGLVTPVTPPAEPEQPEAGTETGAVSANLSVVIVADEDTNSLLIRATPQEYRQLLSTISSMDTAPPQVLINAVIGQVTLTDGTAFGIDWTRVSSNVASGPARLSSRFLPGGILDPESGLAVAGSGLVLTRTFMDGSAVIDATLRALAIDNEVTLLARPTLLATNNKEGSFTVGQEVPVNSGTIGLGNGQTAENIAYKEVGIELTITPQINDEGFVSLEILQALSSIEGDSGVGGNPIFSNQRITTTVGVADQETIILGGLIQDDASDQNSGVPVLQKIPLFGALFSYQDIRTQRRELFVILRPQIVRGDGSETVLMQEYRASFTNVANLLREAGL
jgi:general secretion pathway protein D